MQRMTRCPGCEVAVPLGRWCNRCGARLDGTSARRRPRPWRWTGAAALAGIVAVVLVVVLAGAGLAGRGTSFVVGGVIELPEVAHLADPLFVPYRATIMATVVCSSILLREVPVRQIGAAEVGDLVALPIGDCVVHARPKAGRAGIGTALLAQ